MTPASGTTRPLSEADWVVPDRLFSPSNAIVKLVRSLKRRKGRQDSGLFLVEGERAVVDALRLGQAPHTILIQPGYTVAAPESLSALRGHAHALRVVSDDIFASLTDTVTPQGIVAAFPFPVLNIDPDATPLVVVADKLQDPGNLGTLLRSAAGAGATLVLLVPGTVDPFNPKVVRGAMGAHFRLPIRTLDEQSLQDLKACTNRFVAEANATTTYDRADWREPSAIIVGSEAHGPSEAIRAEATSSISIPLDNEVESLNAGVAASIMLFEAQRQRRIH